MSDASSLLRHLPRVDEILDHPRMVLLLRNAPRLLGLHAVREAVEEARSQVRAGHTPADVSADAIAGRAAEILRRTSSRSLRRVINATGIILHTGLGRAPLSKAAQQALADVAAGYSNVQTDLDSGQRTHREIHVEWLLQQIIAAEAALVTNNNAAATVLVLNTLAAGRQVIISRGELVEIGGSFRIPEIMKLAGCSLVEVGCTNRTHLRDYESAITAETGLILSVHQSNYRIQGFASQVEVDKLAALAHSRGLLCAHDLGSGALLDLRQYGLPHEPSAPESLAADADVTLFSGDKLLGGPQCGIIVGKADPIKAMRKNPYYRVFRVGKLTLAALEGTLRLLLDAGSAPQQHRVLSLLTYPLQEIRARADGLTRRVTQECGKWLQADTRETESEVGGGSLSGHPLPTIAVRLQTGLLSAAELAHRLRLSDPPVFTRVHEDAVLLDPRTILPEEDELVLGVLKRIGKSSSVEES